MEDEAAPAALRIQAITAVGFRRISRDSRILELRSPDAFDRAMARLAERGADPAVRAAAGAYLERVRPLPPQLPGSADPPEEIRKASANV